MIVDRWYQHEDDFVRGGMVVKIKKNYNESVEQQKRRGLEESQGRSFSQDKGNHYKSVRDASALDPSSSDSPDSNGEDLPQEGGSPQAGSPPSSDEPAGDEDDTPSAGERPDGEDGQGEGQDGSSPSDGDGLDDGSGQSDPFDEPGDDDLEGNRPSSMKDQPSKSDKDKNKDDKDKTKDDKDKNKDKEDKDKNKDKDDEEDEDKDNEDDENKDEKNDLKDVDKLNKSDKGNSDDKNDESDDDKSEDKNSKEDALNGDTKGYSDGQDDDEDKMTHDSDEDEDSDDDDEDSSDSKNESSHSDDKDKMTSDSDENKGSDDEDEDEDGGSDRKGLLAKAVGGDFKGIADDMADDSTQLLKTVGKEVGKTAAKGIGGYLGTTVLMMMVPNALKSAVSTAVSWIASFVQKAVDIAVGIWDGLVAGVGNLGAAAVSIVTLGAVSVGGTATVQNIIQQDNIRRSGDMVAYCETQTEAMDSMSFEAGDLADPSDAQRQNAQKTYSLLSEMGYTDEHIAGVLGNAMVESNLDSTAVETIYDEPHQIGPKKQHAESVDFNVAQIDPAYASRFPGVKQVGIGLYQWSNGRNGELRGFANSIGQHWSDIGVQMAFMMTKDSDAAVLQEMKNQTDMSVAEATDYFMTQWERPADQSESAKAGRRAKADQMYQLIQDFDVDKDFANSILNNLNVDQASANGTQASAEKGYRKAYNNLDLYCQDMADSIEEASAELIDGRVVASGSLGDFQKHFEQYEGIPYDFGGDNPDVGLDCSGLWYVAVKEHFGVEIPRDSRGQYAASKKIAPEDRQPGDFVFFTDKGAAPADQGGRVTHVALYMGNGMVFHASGRGSVPNSSGSVKYDNIDDSPYWQSRNPRYGRLIEFGENDAEVL